MDKEHLIAQLKIYNHHYRLGNPIVPDLIYDQLVDTLKEQNWYPYETEVEPEPLYKNHIRHTKPLLSMKKAKTDEDINKWLLTVEKSAIELGISLKDVWININQKLDGIACVLENGIFATRGNGIEGNNVSNIMDKGIMLDIPKNKKGQILGELVIDLKYFNKYLSSEFSNARNFVSGAIMSDTLNNLTEKAFNDKAIIFQSYSTLPSFSYNLESIRDNFREAEKALWSNTDYLIDGIIFMVINEDIILEMGCTSHHPNYAIALKPNDKIYTSKVIKLHWQCGRSGKITPRVEIEPVNIDGVNVRFASGHNARMVIDMGIEIGVTVEIIRSGSVIPYIVKVVESE